MNVKAPLLTSHPTVFQRGEEGGGGGCLLKRLRETDCQNGRKFEFLRKILKQKKHVAFKLQSLFAEVIAVICNFILKIITLRIL